MQEELRYFALGELKVVRDGLEIDLGRARQQAVLAVLLLRRNSSVSVSTIVDSVWGEQPPRNARNTVQTYVSRLRRALQPGQGPHAQDVALASTATGYLLRGGPDSLDLDVFDRHLTSAHDHYRRGGLAAAAAELEAAFALWRGEAFSGLAGPLIEAERARLCERYVGAWELRVAVHLDAGEHAAAVAELSRLVSQYPLQERLRGLLMTALYRCGRQAEALQVFQDLRTALVEQLGIDPGTELQELHHRILAADPALDAAAGTVPSGPTVPRQLPAAVRSFVGRQPQLACLTKAMDDTAEPGTTVITAIGGTGGIGKTSLAVHWAHQHADRFPDGHLFVNLRGFDPSGQPMPVEVALRGFLDALGVAAAPVDLDAQIGLYRSLVAGKRMLVILDNARDAAQVAPLLPGTPTCTVLVTSRHRLAGLVSGYGAHLLDLDVLSEAEARELVGGHLGHRRLAAEPSAAAELVMFCEGLPLALGIVAARATTHPDFPLAALADELRDASARLDALDAGDLNANLRAVLSWSYRTLDAATAGVFGLLGLALGPDIGLPAAASLIGQPTARTRVILRELENAHLVQQHVPGRYRMHDLVRLYAAETSQNQELRTEALRRLIDFYLHTAHHGQRLLNPTRQRLELGARSPGCLPYRPKNAKAALAWFDVEHPCLLAAQQLAVDCGWHRAVWQLAYLLITFHDRRVHIHDDRTAWLAGMAAAQHLGDSTMQATAYRRLGYNCLRAGRHTAAIDHLQHALALAEREHDIAGEAHAHQALASMWGGLGDDRTGLEYASRSLWLFQALDNPAWTAGALNGVGWRHAQLGHFDEARSHCEAALTILGDHHDPDIETCILDSLGYIAHHTGDYTKAVDYYERVLALSRDIGDTDGEALGWEHLGQTYLALGQRDRARHAWLRALDLYRSQHRTAQVDRVHQQLATFDGTAQRSA